MCSTHTGTYLEIAKIHIILKIAPIPCDPSVVEARLTLERDPESAHEVIAGLVADARVTVHQDVSALHGDVALSRRVLKHVITVRKCCTELTSLKHGIILYSFGNY